MKIRWRCPECKDLVVSTDTIRHQMDYCKCNKTAMDLEKEYTRLVGNPEIIERIEE